VLDYTNSDSAPAISKGSTATEIERTLSTLASITQAEVFEIRILPQGKCAFFERANIARAAQVAAKFDALPRTAGIYVTLNPVSTQSPKSGRPARDEHIVCRRLLLVDLDPERDGNGKVSSTETEKAAANARALTVQKWLTERGWPAPLVADSGNGAHLLYAIELPNDDEHTRLVKQVLQVLDQRFSDAAVKVDTTVHNASRITKLYGTWVRKGPNTAERPHRQSLLLEEPEQIQRITTEQLETLAAEFVEERPRQPERPAPMRTNVNGNGRTDEMEVMDALNSIDATDRDVWFKVGAALQDEFGEAGRRIWDWWAQQSDKFDAADQEKNWRSFTPGKGITIRTVFKMAQDAG
jgi:hypothetical protein